MSHVDGHTAVFGLNKSTAEVKSLEAITGYLNHNNAGSSKTATGVFVGQSSLWLDTLGLSLARW